VVASGIACLLLVDGKLATLFFVEAGEAASQAELIARGRIEPH